MLKLPEYVGPCAFGIKMGVVFPGSDLSSMIVEALRKVKEDELLSDGDTICITESVVARSQNNYVTTEEVAREIREKLSLTPSGKIGVLFPIVSRNRFALILRGIAEAVPQGEVIVQLSYPADEVGNQVIPPGVAEELEEKKGGYITSEDLGESYRHPLTGVDYIKLYREIIAETGAKPIIYLCNDPLKILEFSPDGVIVADIHRKDNTRKKVASVLENCITLKDICSSERQGAWSEWGLLGSNMSSGNKLKLAPRQGDKFVFQLQKRIYQELGKKIEVIIYGDGAYKDPSSGIYELADPRPAFGATPGVNGVLRRGVKFKYLVDLHYENGKSEEEILKILQEESIKHKELDAIECEGTTPRRMEDLLASLADLVSGSADAGTPLVLVKGIHQAQL